MAKVMYIYLLGKSCMFLSDISSRNELVSCSKKKRSSLGKKKTNKRKSPNPRLK